MDVMGFAGITGVIGLMGVIAVMGIIGVIGVIGVIGAITSGEVGSTAAMSFSVLFSIRRWRCEIFFECCQIV